jgi:hypothetical protein
MDRTTAEVLGEARDLIERGWCKYKLTDTEGNYCLRAAVGIAAGVYTKNEMGEVGFLPSIQCGLEAMKLDLRAVAALQGFLPEGFNSTVVFNDHPRTTKDDVLSVMNKAIAAEMAL